MAADKTRPKRILVADDDANQRRMIQFCLEELGYQVETAADGQAALDLAQSAEFDSIILDIDMPHMNGLEVLQHLRADEKFKDTFIAMLTAQDSSQMVAQGYAEGANMYLTKPVTASVLARALRD